MGKKIAAVAVGLGAVHAGGYALRRWDKKRTDAKYRDDLNKKMAQWDKEARHASTKRRINSRLERLKKKGSIKRRSDVTRNRLKYG